MQILVPTARAKEPKPALFYSYSKLCNVLFAFALHRREHNNGINTYAVHPGTMTGTGILRHQGAIGKAMNFVAKPWGKTLKQGAATVVYCAADPELSNISGRYFESCWDDEKYHEVALTRDEALQDALWQHTEKLLDKFSVHGE
uniref:Uncharacterized protein n=1 Tax=Plectus sambesii TaxID=2011161 RepID=A0A914XG78_9BILA